MGKGIESSGKTGWQRRAIVDGVVTEEWSLMGGGTQGKEGTLMGSGIDGKEGF